MKYDTGCLASCETLTASIVRSPISSLDSMVRADEEVFTSYQIAVRLKTLSKCEIFESWKKWPIFGVLIKFNYEKKPYLLYL